MFYFIPTLQYILVRDFRSIDKGFKLFHWNGGDNFSISETLVVATVTKYSGRIDSKRLIATQRYNEFLLLT